MTSQGFSFPPPPPPPPPKSYPAPNNPVNYGGYPAARGRGNASSGHRGQWRGGMSHGRGRGYAANSNVAHAGGHAPRGQSRGGYGNAPGTYQPFGQEQHQPYQQPRQYQQQNVPFPNQNPVFHQQQQYSPQYNQQNQQSQQKRPYSTAFPKPVSTTRPQAPPAVPSFGLPLPTLAPEQPATSEKQPKKKHPRKQNQLGLTPAQEEHESSSESASDVDEETKLINQKATDGVQISYKGQTSTLKSSDDIAAWIAERKKRFPTQERIDVRKQEAAERKKKYDEAKKARDEAFLAKRKEKQQSRSVDADKRAAGKDNVNSSKTLESVTDKVPASESGPTDALAKAKLKAEKLRKRALKAEAAAKKAEAKAAQATTDASASNQTHQSPSNAAVVAGPSGIPIDPIAEDIDLSDVASSVTSDTSSSGSSDDDDDDLSDSNSEASSSTSSLPPEQLSSKSDHPIRVAPPPRTAPTPDSSLKKSSKPCNKFRSTGKCPRGDQCRYSHDPPNSQPRTPGINARGGGGRDQQGPTGKNNGRKTLYQILLAKQEEEEHKHILKSILYLNEKGVLDDIPNTTTTGVSEEGGVADETT